ncbi:MAG: hypothetical protein IE916_01315 [Epsilonproteobacteria bacterium]|nr:hypothetical protein [Campylobacterota bacterium]
MFEDIYFLNPEEALRVAKEQNRWGANGYYLQACYYEGERIESDLPNLLHLPLENMVHDLAFGSNRIPTKIDFTGLDLSSDVKLSVLQSFNASMHQAQMARDELNRGYHLKLLNAKLDFSEPLRCYLMASTSTQVMQFVSKNLAHALEKIGCEVLFDLFYGIEESSSLKKMAEFNPHIFININHLNNGFLNNEIFNIVWFQDPMPILSDDSKIGLRSRDIIYSLSSMIMEKKFAPHMYEIQRFCVNRELFFRDESIPKEEKVVFIGSSHKAILEKDIQNPRLFELYVLLKARLDNAEPITKEYVMELSKEYGVAFYDILLTPFAMAVREACVEWICKQQKLPVEVYGRYWENNPVVAPFYKGEIPHGDKVAKIYNGAKYALVAHSFDMYQQRLPEMAACGTIPLSYNAVGMTEESYEYESSTLLFRTYDELVALMGKEPQESVERIAEDMSFEHFANRIVATVKERLENGR